MIDRRIGALDRARERSAADVPRRDMWYEFKVAPSCPPDKRLHIRPGIVTPSIRWSDFIEDDYIPYTVCDFENQTETDMGLVFVNAGYYLPILLCYNGEWLGYRDDPIFNNVIGTEVETAILAEAQIDGFLNGTEDWYYYRLPLCGVVLRNDGQVGANYAIQAIDAVNRGRSYLFRDSRSSGGLFT